MGAHSVGSPAVLTLGVVIVATSAPSVRRRSIAAGTVGNLVEWFDWSVYAFFAPVFAASFFPAADETAQLLSAFAVFAVGFLLRPLGGAVLGSYADRHGRRAGMTLTILLMAGASLAIALLPTHAAVGTAAPIGLVLARCVQGFSAGGEFGTSSAFLVENAPPGRRAWAGSWQQVSVGAGTLAASGLAAVMFATLPPEALATWGWRAAFGLGAVLGLLGLWLRVSVPDTDDFTHARASGRLERRPLLEVFRSHPRAALRVVGIVCAGTALVQFWFVSLPSVAHLLTGIPVADAQPAAVVALALFTVLQPLSGRLSDRFGRRPLLLFFAIGSGLSVGPAFAALGTTTLSILVPACLSAVLLASYAGSLAAVMAEQFPPQVRTAGISLPYGVAVAVFGGLTPLVATALVGQGQAWAFPAIMIVLCSVSAVVYATMRETGETAA